LPNFYQLLSVDASAPPEKIKRAFRNEIARYHPDKVQHLGKEFQEMAAERAAQLTEAYRILMNAELRAEYDRLLTGGAEEAPAPPEKSGQSTSTRTSESSRARQARPQAQAPPPPPTDRPSRFSFERASRDEFVRRAIIDKVRQAIEAEVGSIGDKPARGFDVSCIAKAKGLFSRAASQRFVARFVPHVDRGAVRETWGLAQKLDEQGDVCVFLVGNSMAPSRELGDAIADERKRGGRGCRVCLVSVDVRDWHALIPSGAPAFCKSILQRIRTSSSV
jgi:curved DNA-binding protein CbpA